MAIWMFYSTVYIIMIYRGRNAHDCIKASLSIMWPREAYLFNSWWWNSLGEAKLLSYSIPYDTLACLSIGFCFSVVILWAYNGALWFIYPYSSGLFRWQIGQSGPVPDCSGCESVKSRCVKTRTHITPKVQCICRGIHYDEQQPRNRCNLSPDEYWHPPNQVSLNYKQSS